MLRYCNYHSVYVWLHSSTSWKQKESNICQSLHLLLHFLLAFTPVMICNSAWCRADHFFQFCVYCRVAEMASSRIRGGSRVEDLSDPNRPTVLADRWRSLFASGEYWAGYEAIAKDFDNAGTAWFLYDLCKVSWRSIHNTQPCFTRCSLSDDVRHMLWLGCLLIVKV